MPTSEAALIPIIDSAIGSAQQEATPKAARSPPATRAVFAVSCLASEGIGDAGLTLRCMVMERSLHPVATTDATSNPRDHNGLIESISDQRPVEEIRGDHRDNPLLRAGRAIAEAVANNR